MRITTLDELERARKQARALVTKRSMISAATGAIPFGLGAPGDVYNLSSLLPMINKLFGLDPKQIDELDEQSKEQLTVLVGKVGSAFAGRFVTEAVIVAVLKRVGVQVASKTAASFVPFVGSGVAATIGFGMMKYVGNGHVEDCFRIIEEYLKGKDGGATAPAAAA